MFNIPYEYNEISTYIGATKPSKELPYNNETFILWVNALYERALSSFIIDGVPEDWTENILQMFKTRLITKGYEVLFVDEKYSDYPIFAESSLSGNNIFHLPTNAIITMTSTDQDSEEKNLIIGKDCAVINLRPNYHGIISTIEYYARRLALIDGTIDATIFNTRLYKMVFANSKTAAKALQKALDRIYAGDPAVVIDKNILLRDGIALDGMDPFELVDFGNPKDVYITDKILADRQQILHDFDSEIGIVSQPIDKKERVNVQEVEVKKVDSTSRASVWIECMNSGFAECNRLFGTNFKARLRSDIDDQTGDSDGEN